MALETSRAAPTADAYNRIFAEHIKNSGQIILQELAACEYVLPAELRAQALATLDFALRMAVVWDIAHALLHALSPRMEQLGLWDEWLPYLEQGLVISREQRDTLNEIQLGLSLGRLQRLLGSYPAAQRTLEDVVARAARLKMYRSTAMGLHQLAYIARLQGHYAQARRYVAQAQANLEDGDAEFAIGYWVLGTIAEVEKEWDEAIEQHSRALAIWQAVGNDQRAAWSLQNLGTTYWRMGHLAEAAAHIRASIRLLEPIHDRVNHAIARMNLGIIYIDLNQPDESLALFTLAESVFREVGDTRHLAMVHNNLAVARRLQQAWEPAIRAAETSVRLWEKLDDPMSLANTLGELGLAYQGADRLDEARATLERGLALLSPLLEQTPVAPQAANLWAELSGYLQAARQ